MLRVLAVVLLPACGGPSAGEADSAVADRTPASVPPDRGDVQTVPVRVTLDGEPVADVLVSQPGTTTALKTDADGEVSLPLDLRQDVLGIIASHPDARIRGEELYGPPEDGEVVEIPLERFDTRDNTAFVFQDPGTPERSEHTGYCSHCHVTIVEDWVVSAHEGAAKNPWVQDLYAGAAGAFADEAQCETAGGQWWTGIGPGTGAPAARCYVGEGALPALNEDCGETSPCDGVAENTGQCADCHAPGIDGVVGGRDLLEATGIPYEHGVHCDVCHKVVTVDTDSVEPGVAGRLQILRPREPSTSAGLGDWTPLTFGPYPDIPNPRMGSVQRDHYAKAAFCSGCHEHAAPVMVPGATLDLDRWPDGRLPLQTTYSELRDGPLGEDVACQSCHMPPDADVGNSADLGNVIPPPEGIATGWYREAGSVRRHAWFGPRSEEQPMLGLAAELFVEKAVAEGVVEVSVTTRNVGPGHAIPTGEPLRSLLLLVEARCDGVALAAVGGDVVPDFGGVLDQHSATEDWTVWPGAQVGDRIVVSRNTGAWRDYPAVGAMADFPPEERGMAEEQWVGQVGIVAVAWDGTITADGVLPVGDRAVRLAADRGLPTEGEPAGAWAGLPGFGFGKVLVGPDGTRHVPHFLAVDVVSDNRLPPTAEWTSQHRFAADCDDPEVEAVLLWRRAPLDLAKQRGWTLVERELARVRR